MRLAFPFLLVGLAFGLLTIVLLAISRIFVPAFVPRSAGLLECDSDRLATTLDLSAFSAAATLELAVFELVHDAARGLALTWCGLGHRTSPCAERRGATVPRVPRVASLGTRWTVAAQCSPVTS